MATRDEPRPGTWGAAIPAYATHLRAAGRSPGTIRLHLHYLSHLRRYAPAPAVMTRARLDAALAIEGWTAETRKSARGVAAGFFRWAVAAGTLATSPADGMPAIHVPPGVPRPIPQNVLADALSAAPAREATMMLLARYAGLRAAEIAAVHQHDYDGAGLYVRGKGGRARYVPILSPPLAHTLGQAAGYLFPGRIGGHLSPGHVSVLLARHLPPPWTAHTLRHAFASAALAGGADILTISMLMGHASVETTRRYTAVPHAMLAAAVKAAS